MGVLCSRLTRVSTRPWFTKIPISKRNRKPQNKLVIQTINAIFFKQKMIRAYKIP
jgi:hypothetical protein